MDKHFPANKGKKVLDSNRASLKNMGITYDESANAKLINREKERVKKVIEKIKINGDVVTPSKVSHEVRKQTRIESYTQPFQKREPMNNDAFILKLTDAMEQTIAGLHAILTHNIQINKGHHDFARCLHELDKTIQQIKSKKL